MKTKSRIFVANFCGHDISKAFDFTSLSPHEAQVNLTEGNVHIFDTDRLIYNMKKRILESSPHDYLLICGSSIVNIIAAIQWLAKNKVLRLLIYNAKENRYVLRNILHKQIIGDLLWSNAHN